MFDGYSDEEMLLDLLMRHAPTIEERYKMDQIYEEMKAESPGDQHTIKRLAGWLYDGLRYGNWPWL